MADHNWGDRPAAMNIIRRIVRAMTAPNNAKPFEFKTLSDHLVAQFKKTVAADWPANAVLTEATSWSAPNGTRCQRFMIDVSDPPKRRLWLVEKSSVTEVTVRPATTSELEAVLAVLRDVGASEEDIAQPIAEANYDCRRQSFELSFIPLEQMCEGTSYKRWYVTYHNDQRPPSVAFILETKRNGCWDTLPGGRVLRGEPW
jgi:hypothetical protein